MTETDIRELLLLLLPPPLPSPLLFLLLSPPSPTLSRLLPWQCILVELLTGEVLFGMGHSHTDSSLAHLAAMHQV